MAKGSQLGFLAVVTALVLTSALLMALKVSLETASGGDLFAVFGPGSLYINNAGRSHGGWTSCAEYDVEVSQACNGTVILGHIAGLVFTLKSGSGDALKVHELQMKLSFDVIRDEITLSNGSAEITLVKVLNDNIWDHKWDGYFVASWGGDAPSEEIRGLISPAVFDLPSHYYVELRLDVGIIAF